MYSSAAGNQVKLAIMPITERLTTVNGLPDATGYAHAIVTTGKLAFVSGQISIDAEGKLVGAGDLRAQTEQSMRNLHAILITLGADWTDVVRLSWYVVDASTVQVIRDVRDEFLRPVLGDRVNPASTLIQVAALFRPEFLVEIDAVVALPD